MNEKNKYSVREGEKGKKTGNKIRNVNTRKKNDGKKGRNRKTNFELIKEERVKDVSFVRVTKNRCV